jgi:hypothetical protein
MRCSRRPRAQLCLLNPFSRYRSEMEIRPALEQFSLSSSSRHWQWIALSFQPISSDLTSLLAMVSARPLLKQLFKRWASELVSPLPSVSALESPLALEWMSLPASELAIRFRFLRRSREVLPLSPHLFSTVPVLAEELESFRAGVTHRSPAFRHRDRPRHLSRRCFAHLRNSWLRHSSESAPAERQRARAQSG